MLIVNDSIFKNMFCKMHYFLFYYYITSFSVKSKDNLKCKTKKE